MLAKRPFLRPTKQSGFSTVELLMTLLIAAAFLAIFYQLYITADSVATKSSHLTSANEVTYAKLQEYENKNFQSITTPGGTTPTQVEDFSASLPSSLPKPVTAVVNTAILTPTLKAVDVKTVYGSGGGQQIIEYTTYIQESGVGR